MKKLHTLSVLSLGVLLSACVQNKPVEVVKGTDYSTVIPQTVVKQVEVPANLPLNATAICRDGSYSTAKENACSGNGGAQTIIKRYHSE